MGGEGGGYKVGGGVSGEVDLREKGPEAAPAAGEETGSGGDGGIAELVKDVENQVIGQRAEEVVGASATGGGGEPGSLGGGFAVAVLHGGGGICLTCLAVLLGVGSRAGYQDLLTGEWLEQQIQKEKWKVVGSGR